MLYPVKFVFVKVRFGTCFTRSGPPAVCVAVSCSWLSAVIAMGMLCTSAPPSVDDEVHTRRAGVGVQGGFEIACRDIEIGGPGRRCEQKRARSSQKKRFWICRMFHNPPCFTMGYFDRTISSPCFSTFSPNTARVVPANDAASSFLKVPLI